MKIVLVTGGFDPLHSGHIAYFNEAKKLGDKLIVGLNSDEWLTRKKGKCFMPVEERVRLLLAMRNVDQVITFDDSDDSSMNAIHITRHMFPDEHIIFANGGDRTSANIKEMNYPDTNVSFSFGVGGDKTQSSSDLLGEWAAPRTERDWGYYRVLHEFSREVKIKELTVDPGKSLSMQRHAGRAEFWFVASGIASGGEGGTCRRAFWAWCSAYASSDWDQAGSRGEALRRGEERGRLCCARWCVGWHHGLLRRTTNRDLGRRGECMLRLRRLELFLISEELLELTKHPDPLLGV